MDQLVEAALPVLSGAIPTGGAAFYLLKRALGVVDALQKQVNDQKDELQKQLAEQKDSAQKQINDLHLGMVEKYVPRPELEKHFERIAIAQKELTEMIYKGFQDMRTEISHVAKNQAQTRLLAEGMQQRRGDYAA